jgi:hypothetical protein
LIVKRTALAVFADSAQQLLPSLIRDLVAGIRIVRAVDVGGMRSRVRPIPFGEFFIGDLEWRKGSAAGNGRFLGEQCESRELGDDATPPPLISLAERSSAG